jgi:hypothetical protein
MDNLKLVGRTSELFINDLSTKEKDLSKIIGESSFLVIGGAG